MAKKGRKLQGGVNPQAALQKAISKRMGRSNDERQRNLTRAGASAAISAGGGARRSLSTYGKSDKGGKTSTSFVGGSGKNSTNFSTGGGAKFGGGKKVFDGQGKAANQARRKGAGTSPFTNTGRPGAGRVGTAGPKLRGQGRVPVGKPGKGGAGRVGKK